MKVDILYFSHNRKEFTEVSLPDLMEHTNPDLVERVIIVDDGSTDGGREWIQNFINGSLPIETEMHYINEGAFCAALTKALSVSKADTVALIGNDMILCPGWLDIAVCVLEKHSKLSYLGLNDVNPIELTDPELYAVTSSKHIGFGLVRRSALKEIPKPEADPKKRKWHGFTTFQWNQKKTTKGFLSPALPIILLDRMPIDPYKTLSEEYVRKGWQRVTDPPYGDDKDFWKWRFSE